MLRLPKGMKQGWNTEFHYYRMKLTLHIQTTKQAKIKLSDCKPIGEMKRRKNIFRLYLRLQKKKGLLFSYHIKHWMFRLSLTATVQDKKWSLHLPNWTPTTKVFVRMRFPCKKKLYPIRQNWIPLLKK